MWRSRKTRRSGATGRDGRLYALEKLIRLDYLLGHVGGYRTEKHANAANPEQLRDRSVEIRFRQVAKAGLVNKIEEPVVERQLAHVPIDVSCAPCGRRACVDIRRIFDTPYGMSRNLAFGSP